MYYILTISNHKARQYKKTKSLAKAQALTKELNAKGIRAYYIKKEIIK